MILQSDYPPDIRLKKEIKSLTQNNFNIFLLCNNQKNLQKVEKINDKFHIIRLQHFQFLKMNLQSIIGTAIFFNPVWLWKIFNCVRKFQIEILHVHDLPLALSAVIIAKFFNIPVVFDMHENYPAALIVWKKRGVERLIKNVHLAKYIEKLVLKIVDQIIVVIEEQRINLISKSIKPSKIHIISNTVDMREIDEIEINQEIVDKYKQHYMILYIGSISKDRGLETPIKAMPKIIQKIPNAILCLVGAGNHKQYLVNLVKNLNFGNFIEFVKWVEFTNVPAYIKASKVSIIPQPANPFINTTIPHKLFHYMYLERPVIVSDAKPLARIITECQCGEIFQSDSPEDFAEAVIRVYNSSTNYGKNGKKAVENKYNWGTTSKSLLKLYNKILKKEKNDSIM